MSLASADPAARASTAPRGQVRRRSHAVAFLLIALLVAIGPFLVYPVFLMKVMCFGLFALAFNLLLGYGGLLSFGHAAYFGMASYMAAYASKYWGVTPELAVLSGVGLAAALGLAFGALSIRRQGIYFSMITLALAQMVFFFCLQAVWFTGGEDGIQAVPRGRLFGVFDLSSDRSLYVFVAGTFLIALAMMYRIIHSPFGQVLRSIRDNEPRAISLGYHATRYKLAVFVLSTAFAGLGGALKALVFQLASLTDVHWSMSGEAVLMALVGGMGTVFGPLLGATVIVTMQNYLASLGAWVTVIQGVVFVLCVMLFREGILGLVARKLRKPL